MAIAADLLDYLAQDRVNANARLNECLRPCGVDHAKNGSSKNGQIRRVGMNFDIPTSPLRVAVDAIATIIVGSLGHRKYLSAPADWVSTGVRFKFRETADQELTA